MAPVPLMVRLGNLVRPALPLMKPYTELYISFAITGYIVWKIPVTGKLNYCIPC